MLCSQERLFPKDLGYNFQYLHDSKSCPRCIATRTFYRRLRAARLHPTRASCEVQLCGLPTFLDRIFQLDVVAKEDSSFNNSVICDTLLLSPESEKDKAPSSETNPKAKKRRRTSKSSDVDGKNSSSEKKARRCKNKKDNLLTDPKKRQKSFTLKSKRTALQNLQPDANYEDDIFQDDRFSMELGQISEDDSESVDIQNMETPRFFAITPCRESPSPSYEDCYSPNELRISRKEAEEYQFRRYRRRKGERKYKVEPPEPSSSVDTTMLLKAARRVLEDQIKKEEKRIEEENEEEEKDYYFDCDF